MPPRSSGRAHAQYLHGWPSLGTRPAEAVHLFHRLTGVVAGRHEPGLVVVQLHSAQSLMPEAASALHLRREAELGEWLGRGSAPPAPRACEVAC